MIKKHVLLLNWLVRAENYLSWQSFTACLRNDFGESIYVLGVCVTLTATIFHRHLKIAAVLNGFALWLAGNFHRRIFISHRLKMTVEFSIDILSYNRTRTNLQYLELKPSFLVIWQNLFQSCIFWCYRKTTLEISVVILSAFANFLESLLNGTA